MLWRPVYVVVLEKDANMRDRLSNLLKSALGSFYLPSRIHSEIGCLTHALQSVFGAGYYDGPVDLVVVGGLWERLSQQTFVENLRTRGFAGRILVATGAPQSLRGVCFTERLGIYSIQSNSPVDEALRLPNQFDAAGEYNFEAAARRVVYNLFCRRNIG